MPSDRELRVMSANQSDHQTPEQDQWARRRASSARLGWILAGVALALFAISLWKYRPL